MNTKINSSRSSAGLRAIKPLLGSASALLLIAATAHANGWGWGSSSESSWSSKDYGSDSLRLHDDFSSRLKVRFQERLSTRLTVFGNDLTVNQRAVAGALTISPQLSRDLLQQLRFDQSGRTFDGFQNNSWSSQNGDSQSSWDSNSSYSDKHSYKHFDKPRVIRPFSDLFIQDLDLLSPAPYAAIYQIGFALSTIQTLNLLRRVDDIRFGANGFQTLGGPFGCYMPEATGPRGAAGPEGKGSKELIPPPENRWGTFVTGVGEFTTVGNGDRNARGYDMTTGGFTIGADYRFGQHFALGILAGYANTGTDLVNDGRVDVDGGKLGIYATYFNGGFYITESLGVGYNSYDLRRSGLGGQARGTTEGAEFDGLISTGYDWKAGKLSVGVTAGFQYTSVGINSFIETGSLAPLTIVKQSQDSIRSTIGGRASYDWEIGGVIIKPEFRAAWQHEYGDTRSSIASQFANGGNGFTVFGPNIGRDSLLLGAGVAVLWNERTSIYAYYDGDLARSNYESNNVSGGVRLAF